MTQEVASRAANRVQAVVPLLANSIRGVSCINPKHKGERQIELEEDQIKVKNDRLRVKMSIKS